jgi:hypothetical protein
MATIVAQLAEPVLGYDLTDLPDSWHYVKESELCAIAKAAPRMRPIGRQRGLKQAVETRYYHDNAQALARLANEMAQKEQEPVLPVLFRDADGTRGHPANWSDKWQSMRDGFDSAGCAHGVPMLAMPKSEAWLIGWCSKTLTDCSGLEALPGNDASPNSAKTRLEALTGTPLSAADWVDRLTDTPLSASEVDRLSTMPSFNHFRQALSSALKQLISNA